MLQVSTVVIAPFSLCYPFPFLKVGDGTNFVLVLAGALMNNAEELLKMGLSPTEVAEGYETAGDRALDLLPSELYVVV